MSIYDGGGSDYKLYQMKTMLMVVIKVYTATTNATGVSFWGNTARYFTITNISVKEVGQDWTFGTGWILGR